MDPQTQKICAICQKELKNDHISFTCDHSICFQCYPYLVFNLLNSKGISKEFFEKPQNEHLCFICGIGKTILPYDIFLKNFRKRNLLLMRSPKKQTKNYAKHVRRSQRKAIVLIVVEVIVKNAWEKFINSRSFKPIKSQFGTDDDKPAIERSQISMCMSCQTFPNEFLPSMQKSSLFLLSEIRT